MLPQCPGGKIPWRKYFPYLAIQTIQFRDGERGHATCWLGNISWLYSSGAGLVGVQNTKVISHGGLHQGLRKSGETGNFPTVLDSLQEALVCEADVLVEISACWDYQELRTSASGTEGSQPRKVTTCSVGRRSVTQGCWSRWWRPPTLELQELALLCSFTCCFDSVVSC